jgi:preprotein translocase subunit Sec61beta
MARKDKIYIPAGVGGLVRYPEEEKEALKLKPMQLVFFVAAIVIFELILKFLF